MVEFIDGKTANEVWRKAANMLLAQETALSGRTGDVCIYFY